jgi:tetratricopeptide (TPR) repeat protein/tRNA A-37 threonylcarbamoyl transferase component Bud32
VRERLAKLHDADLEASLAHIGRRTPTSDDAFLTSMSATDDTLTAIWCASDAGVDGGRFRVLRPHAQCGLGAVFVALDTELNREVALKQIKEEYADRAESRSRFVLEAEITGGLEHPGIVPVYSLGHSADGRPFYAMRFVRGDSLREAVADFHKSDGLYREPGARLLALQKLLRRFLDVCNAIAYAHSRGVLHRDLKPANIMVGKYGETLVVDWGLAKVVGRHEPSGEATLRPSAASDGKDTLPGLAVGTPAFMSPEQAGGDVARLGPPSDVYSLGATLYHLLTGMAPFETGDAGDVLRRVQRGEFLRPRQLDPSIPHPLEAICLKAMALRPEGRYPNCRALADDIERWLADEPVSAWREPWGAQVGRWGRRHRSLVATAMAILVTATVGLSTGLVAVNAEKNRTELARQGEAHQRKLAVTRETQARENEAEMRAVLAFVQDRILAAARPEGQEGGLGHDATLRKAVEAALPQVESLFQGRPLVEASVRMTVGSSLFYLGDAAAAEQQYRIARDRYAAHFGPDHPDTLSSMNWLANSYDSLGRYAEALKLHEQTLEVRRATLGPTHPDTLMSMNNLANSYDALGRDAEALKIRQETLVLRRAQLGRDHPHTLMSMHNLANSYFHLGRYADALKIYQETFILTRAQLGPDHPETLRSMYCLACDYFALGQYREALKLHDETLKQRKAKLGPDHPDTLWSMIELAGTLVALERSAEAAAVIDDCLRRAKVQVVEPRLVPRALGVRMLAFEKQKDVRGCRQTVEMLEKLNPTDADSLYNVACYRAITAASLRKSDPSSEAATTADTDANRAMEWLKKAVAAGYNTPPHVDYMMRDLDLDALRDRDDFRQLMAALMDRGFPADPFAR